MQEPKPSPPPPIARQELPQLHHEQKDCEMTELQYNRHRKSLNGCWILDKSRGEWSMNHYLETMDVDPLTIEAHSKGEMEHDTVHSIELSTAEPFVSSSLPSKLRIIKRSPVNNDLVVELDLNREQVEYLPPGNRPKQTLAVSDPSMTTLQITSSLTTMNGPAIVIDIKRLVQEAHGSILVQELTIRNEQSNKSHTTVRYFNPIPFMDYVPTASQRIVASSTTLPISVRQEQQQNQQPMGGLSELLQAETTTTNTVQPMKMEFSDSV